MKNSLLINTQFLFWNCPKNKKVATKKHFPFDDQVFRTEKKDSKIKKPNRLEQATRLSAFADP